MKNLPKKGKMGAGVPPGTKQGQEQWMADDFPDLLRLDYNSSILFMGNFPKTTQCAPLFLVI